MCLTQWEHVIEDLCCAKKMTIMTIRWITVSFSLIWKSRKTSSHLLWTLRSPEWRAAETVCLGTNLERFWTSEDCETQTGEKVRIIANKHNTSQRACFIQTLNISQRTCGATVCVSSPHSVRHSQDAQREEVDGQQQVDVLLRKYLHRRTCPKM